MRVMLAGVVAGVALLVLPGCVLAARACGESRGPGD